MVFYVTMVIFPMTLRMNKWTNTVTNDGWVHPSAKTLHSLVNKLWWNIVMDDCNLDENHFVSDIDCNTVNLYSPQDLQGMTNNVELAFSVGDTTPRLQLVQFTLCKC